MAFKISYNLMVRRKEEQLKHSHIFDKKKEADSLTIALRQQNATEEQISEMVNFWVSIFLSLETLYWKVLTPDLYGVTNSN